MCLNNNIGIGLAWPLHRCTDHARKKDIKLLYLPKCIDYY